MKRMFLSSNLIEFISYFNAKTDLNKTTIENDVQFPSKLLIYEYILPTYFIFDVNYYQLSCT